MMVMMVRISNDEDKNGDDEEEDHNWSHADDKNDWLKMGNTDHFQHSFLQSSQIHVISKENSTQGAQFCPSQ